MADVAHMLSTPLSEVLEMHWADVMDWHQEAVRISGTSQT